MVVQPSAQDNLLADGAYHEAMQRAGHLLAARPRTEHELRARLTAAGFDEDVIERTIVRLQDLALVDDRAFARQWIEERAARRAPEALIAELTAKGVDRPTAEEAIADAGIDEEAQAIHVASRLMSKVARRPLEQQGLALLQMLQRRGFSYEAAEAGARSCLPPEGWD